MGQYAVRFRKPTLVLQNKSNFANSLDIQSSEITLFFLDKGIQIEHLLTYSTHWNFRKENNI